MTVSNIYGTGNLTVKWKPVNLQELAVMINYLLVAAFY